MKLLPKKQFEAAKQAAARLDSAAADMRVLTSLRWDPSLRAKFLSSQKLPKPEYQPIDMSDAREAISDARKYIDGDHIVMEWLDRLASTLSTTASLIETRGTKAFYKHSAALYGHPKELMLDNKTRVLDLATHMDATLDGIDFDQLVVEGFEQHLNAQDFARELESRLAQHWR